MVKSDTADNPSMEAGISSLATRKQSTVSAARLLLLGEKVEYLNEDQKAQIRFCWKRIEADVARVGVITFVQ